MSLQTLTGKVDVYNMRWCQPGRLGPVGWGIMYTDEGWAGPGGSNWPLALVVIRIPVGTVAMSPCQLFVDSKNLE
jgi:hypothetical protein